MDAKGLEFQKQNTVKFLKSYFLRMKLAEVSGYDEDEDMSTSAKPTAKVNPFDEELGEGQIRLLADTERITYVVLLKRWDDDAYLVMPFSPFDAPASDEEFATEHDGGMYMRVLQAWNTRSLLDETLRRSWCVGELPQKDLDDAMLLWRGTLEDIDLPDDLVERTGVHIYRKEDPRLDYKREELKNFAKIDAEELAKLDA